MADVTQERTISGRGLFRLNDDFRECKRIILYADAIRPPANAYQNVTWNPDKGFYANVTFSFRGSVMLALPMNYAKQGFVIHQNDAQQLGASLVCALDNILDSFVQYAISQGIPYTKNNGIKNHTYSAFIYDEVRFVCYSGCAISLRIVGEETQKCDENDARSNYPPPPPPPSQNPVPLGTPVEVSPPYADEPPPTNGQLPDTQPDPIDDTNIPGPCPQRALRYRIISAQFPEPGLTADAPYEGEFERTEITQGTSAIQRNIGFIAGQTIDGECVGGKYYGLFSDAEIPFDFQILDTNV